MVDVNKERPAALLALKGMSEDRDTKNDDSVGLLEEEEHKFCILTFRSKQTDEGDWKPFWMQINSQNEYCQHYCAQFHYAVLNQLQLKLSSDIQDTTLSDYQSSTKCELNLHNIHLNKF